MGLWGATGVGVGAIVGGGILALAGVAYAATGPGAIVAFALNGVIAVLTALSFAEMSAAFPESGGTYAFAKKVLNVRAAFTIGWIVWFASIVAAVLYSLGFATFAVEILSQFRGGSEPLHPAFITLLAMGATAFYSIGLMRKAGGGGEFATIGKVVVFCVLILGGAACLALALFQGIAVPKAGIIGAIWIFIGLALYLRFLSLRASMFDASAEARDPSLVQLRGRSPLVLVPVANPSNVGAMVTFAHAMAPPAVGRVLLLNVVKAPTEALEGDDPPPQLVASQEVLREALTVSFHEGFAPEALTTIAPRPWEEIIRVARIHRCESLLLGFSNLTERMLATDLEHLISGVKSDVAVLRARPGWKLSNVEKYLCRLVVRPATTFSVPVCSAASGAAARSKSPSCASCRKMLPMKPTGRLATVC